MMTKQIAGKLGLRDITAKVHRANMMRKMGAHSVAELVRFADTLAARKVQPQLDALVMGEMEYGKTESGNLTECGT